MKECADNAGISHEIILGPTLFLLYINDLPNDVIYKLVIYADDTAFYSEFDRASDFKQQFVLAAEFESDLRSSK